MARTRRVLWAIALGTFAFLTAFSVLASLQLSSSSSSSCPPCPLDLEELSWEQHKKDVDPPGMAWLRDLDGRRGPMLRIYVYNLGDRLRYWNNYVSHSFCKTRVNSYEMDYEITRFLERSAVRTYNASKAHLFYIPALPTCVMQACKMTHTSNVCRRQVVDPYMNAVLDHVEQDPWFKRSGGRDHILTITWDPGRRAFFRDVQQRIQPLIILENTGVKGDSGAFIAHHDIVIPQRPRFDTFYERDPFNCSRVRPYLAYFRGVIYGNHPRAALRALQSSPDMMIVNTKVGTRTQYKETQEEYWSGIANATFCLCPTGLQPWSARFFDCIFGGSIPVLMARDIVLPFEDFVPYREMIVSVPEEQIEHVGEILRAISPEIVARKQDALSRWAPTFMYHNFREVQDVEGDAYHTLLKVLARRASVYPAMGRELDVGV